jgi:hypothetical protein
MNTRRIARQTAGWYLALALLLAPLLGLVHGVVHGPLGLHGGSSVASVVAHADSPHAAHHDHVHGDHGHGWLETLFSAHGDASDCRVYDQLSHGDGVLVVPMLALPMALSSFVFHLVEGDVLARWAALFEARAPPLAR